MVENSKSTKSKALANSEIDLFDGGVDLIYYCWIKTFFHSSVKN